LEEEVECTAKRRKGEGEEIAEALLGRSQLNYLLKEDSYCISISLKGGYRISVCDKWLA
jgi:hypothetical protein